MELILVMVMELLTIINNPIINKNTRRKKSKYDNH